MAVLLIVLILTGVTGTHSITTVSNVSVKAEASVSIPCSYNQQYRNNVKYLCSGYTRFSCTDATKTNKPDASGKFLISDDQEQKTFTVTIKQLTNQDTDFWCIVEINYGIDNGKYFHLSVTNGTPSLHVDHQKVTGFTGENITIKCRYSNSGEMKWCRLGGECVTKSAGVIDGTTVTIDESVSNVFAVSMSGLRPENSGWYFCAKGDFQMPVHLTVTEKPTISPVTVTEDGTNTTITPTTITEDGAVSKISIKHEQNRTPLDLIILIISLGFLVLIAVVASFIFILLRHRKARDESKDTKLNEEEVIYSDVICNRRESAQGEAQEDDFYSKLTLYQQNI